MLKVPGNVKIISTFRILLHYEMILSIHHSENLDIAQPLAYHGPGRGLLLQLMQFSIPLAQHHTCWIAGKNIKQEKISR